MSKKEILNKLKKGDSILIDYTKELNKFEDEDEKNEIVTKLSLVLKITDTKIKFQDSSSIYPFELTKQYLLNSDLELELIENC